MSQIQKAPNKTTLLILFFWLAVFLACLWFLNVFHSILFPFVLSFILAYLLDPLIRKLMDIAPKISRGFAIALVMMLFLIILAGLMILIVPALIEQVQAFISDLPRLLQSFAFKIESLFGAVPFVEANSLANSPDFKQLSDWLSSNSQNIWKVTQTIIPKLFNTGAYIVSFLSLIFLTPVVTFYILLDWPKLKSNIAGLIPRNYEHHVSMILTEINKVLSGFLRGQLLVCSILAAWFAVSLSVVGLNYGALIGVIIGFVAFIPYLGTWIGIVLALGTALTQFDSVLKFLSVAIVLIIGQLVESNFLSPKLVGDRVNLPPVWIIFALFAGGVIAGFTGIIIAVPVAASIGVLVRFLIDRYKDSVFYLGFNVEKQEPNE